MSGIGINVFVENHLELPATDGQVVEKDFFGQRIETIMLSQYKAKDGRTVEMKQIYKRGAGVNSTAQCTPTKTEYRVVSQ